VDGQVREGPGERTDAVVEADRAGFFRLVVDRDLDAVVVHGNRAAVRTLLESLPPSVVTPGRDESTAAA
jgi:hypothetical protein